jgi:hypothetical protein
MYSCKRFLLDCLKLWTEIYNLYRYRKSIKLMFRHIAARMADGGFGRFLSLPDMTAGDKTPIGHSGPSRSLANIRGCSSSSTGDITASHSGSQPEYGIELLIAGSPISDDIIVDTEILDYESDDASQTERGRLVPAEREPTAMDTSNIEKDRAANSSGTTGHLNATYYQCRASRLNSFRDTLISISADGTFGKKVVSVSPTFGSLEDHDGIEKTFAGSRILKNNVTVNQSCSMSFDPCNFVCVSCDKEHKIIDDSPMVFCFSDQNFVPFVATANNRCMNIVRLENATLSELVEFAKEVLCTVRIPDGSVLLFGSGSQLGRCGTTIYASEWMSVVAQVTSTWRGIHVCPLIPLIVSACPGMFTREIVEFTVWLDHVYEGDTKGLRDSWVGVAEAMEHTSEGSATMDSMDTYKLALPPSLIPGAPLASITICSIGSRPNTFPGLSKDNCSELLRLLIATIFTNFRACESPEMFLVRTDNAQSKMIGPENPEQKVMLVGASNLKYSSDYFSHEKMDFVDQSEPGWSASVSNIGKLLTQTEKNVQDGATAFMFDILGNTSVRFEQFDGSSALPYKSGGRFHLGGKTVVSSPDTFSKTIDAILPVLRATKGTPCVIIPPLPRYLFARCCDDAGHCTNFDQSDFAQNLLSGFIQLRNLLIRTLVQKNFKVLDTCCVTSCKTTANIAERLSEMKKVTSKDGVHFVAAGYGNLAARATAGLVAMMAAPRREEKTTTHFWRGFKSSHGSRDPKVSLPGSAKSRGRGNPRGGRLTRGFHPYYRK